MNFSAAANTIRKIIKISEAIRISSGWRIFDREDQRLACFLAQWSGLLFVGFNSQTLAIDAEDNRISEPLSKSVSWRAFVMLSDDPETHKARERCSRAFAASELNCRLKYAVSV